MIGSRIAHFEITASLGKGGMGEVYRARDTRLDRDVAIKVLPADIAGHRERLSRFRREARLLARLSHPNIATVHEIGDHEGRPFLVMELVSGEDLAARLARGPLALPAALSIATQIARALEAAHAHKIVHRDLKPPNVMLKDNGDVKVLDFGLAKALEPAGPRQAPMVGTAAPTMSQATREGAIQGTASYMSPEQARGRPVDERCDLWAFGCVLFEMLSGERPFKGDSFADILGAVLTTEPDWTALPAGLPRSVQRLLRRCLVKDPDGRLHHPADARLELEASDETDPEVGALEEAPASARRGGAFGARGWPLGLAMLAIGVLVGALAVWLLRGLGEDPVPVSTSRWTIGLGGSRIHDGGRSDPLAVTADGSTIAYIAQSPDARYRLHLRRIDQVESRALEGTEGASNPFFSPDGRWLGYFVGDRMKKVSVGGGAPVDIATVPLDNLGATWNSRGTIAFCSYGSGLWRVAEGGGEPELVAAAEALDSAQVRWPQFTPEGRRVLLILQRQAGPQLALVDVNSGDWQLVPGLQEVGKARYLPPGYLVLAQRGELLAAPFDLQAGRLLDSPQSMVDGVSMLPFGGNANFEVSPSGTLVFVPGVSSPDARLVWVDRSGEMEAVPDATASFVHPNLSPDGSLLAVEVGSELGDRQVHVLDLRRGSRTALTSEGRNAQPVWHPEGRHIAVSSDRGEDWDLYLYSVGGVAEPLLVAPREQWLGSWGPDGSQLAFYQVDPVTTRDLWFLDIGSDGGPRRFRQTLANERGVNISPDGRWLAYVSDESGRDEIYVESFPRGEARWTMSTAGGREPVWSVDGTELFYREDQKMMSVAVRAGEDALDPDTPVMLFEGAFDTEVVGNPNYDVAPDGRFLMVERIEPASSGLTVVLHWELEIAEAFSS